MPAPGLWFDLLISKRPPGVGMPWFTLAEGWCCRVNVSGNRFARIPWHYGCAYRVPVFPLIILLGFIIGLGITPAQSAMNTIMQIAVPDEKRGRVGSSFNAITTFASLISMVFAAGLSGVLNLRTIYIVFGSLVTLSGILGFWLIREPEESHAVEEVTVVTKETVQ